MDPKLWLQTKYLENFDFGQLKDQNIDSYKLQ